MTLTAKVIDVHGSPRVGVVDATFEEWRMDANGAESPHQQRRLEAIDSEEHPYGLALKIWREEGGVVPLSPLSAGAAKVQLLAMIDAATRPILDAYPPAERLSWDAKEIAAAAFMVAAEPVLADYGLLRGEVAAELAIAAGDVTLEQLATKAEAVLWMASQWRALVSTLSGLRKRYEAAIDAAEDDAGRRAVIEAAQATIGGLGT